MIADLVLILVGVVAVISAVTIRVNLKNHVSMVKVRDLSDPKAIFGDGGIPSADVLNEKGLELLQLSRTLLVIGILFMVLPAVAKFLSG